MTNEISTFAKQILGLTPNLNHTTGFICSFLVMITGITCLLLIENGLRQNIIPTKHTMPMLSRGLQIFFGCMFIFGCSYLISGYNVTKIAKTHGMFQDDLTWNQIIEYTESSPVEDILPDDLSNSIILYFKFGCKDCESTYKQQIETFGHLEKVYWISTRSEQGKELMKKYPVKEVPSGVYITDDLKPVTCTLHMKNQGETVLHKANAELLLDLYNGANKN